jgi:hypothetical protein
LACYKEVLQKDKGNAQALAGLEQIVARYANWTERALNRGQLHKAERYLKRLRRVES